MHFQLTLLGTNSALPAHNRHPTAQVLRVQEHWYLIDCGEGTQMRMQEFGIKKHKIDAIFISHLHGDHIFGLIGLLTSFDLNNRNALLEIFGPEGLEEIIYVHLKLTGGTFGFPLRIHVVDPTVSSLIFENLVLTVTTIPLKHRIPTAGFLFREKKRPRNIRPEKIQELGLTVPQILAAKEGVDLELPDGRLIPNEDVTLAPPAPRSYAFCSDTAYDESIVPIIRGVDLLYHESTFLEENKEQARLTMHSTAREAALIARQAQAGRLILGHYSSRYKQLDGFLAEAKAVFPDTVLGIEGEQYEVKQ